MRFHQWKLEASVWLVPLGSASSPCIGVWCIWREWNAVCQEMLQRNRLLPLRAERGVGLNMFGLGMSGQWMLESWLARRRR